MTIKQLNEILDELNCYKRDKSKLIVVYINERLNKSLETYYKTMIDSFNFVSKQNEIKLMKTFSKDK